MSWFFPSTLSGWLTSSVGILALVALGLYLSGGSKLVGAAAEGVAPLARGAGNAVVRFAGWFLEGLGIVWAKPVTLTVIAVAVGLTGSYMGIWHRKEVKAQKVEIAECKAEVKRYRPKPAKPVDPVEQWFKDTFKW